MPANFLMIRAQLLFYMFKIQILALISESDDFVWAGFDAELAGSAGGAALDGRCFKNILIAYR